VQQADLGRGQCQGLAAEPDFVPAEVDRQRTAHDPLAGAALLAQRPAAQHDLDPRDQFLRAERLRQVVVCADAEAQHDVAFLSLRSDHDHGDGTRHRIGLHTAADLDAVDAGQHQVEDQQIGGLGADQAQPLLSVPAREHFVAFPLEVVLEDFADVRLVLDDDDLGFRHVCSR
jgi:hypothetical protein